MPHKKGLTLIEIIVVVLVIGILAALSLPGFDKTKERTLDKEAQASLSLIQAAERIYKMEAGFYYPPTTNTSNIADINTHLKVSLPTAGTLNWSYSIDDSALTGTARAVRFGQTRTWEVDSTSAAGDPACTTDCL